MSPHGGDSLGSSKYGEFLHILQGINSAYKFYRISGTVSFIAHTVVTRMSQERSQFDRRCAVIPSILGGSTNLGNIMFKFMLATSVAMGLALSGQSVAQTSDTGFYVEGGYQLLDINPKDAESGIDSSGIAARIGYQFNPTFSLEGELATGLDDGKFDYNTDEDEFNLDDNNDGDFNDLIAASGDFEMNYLIGVFGKAQIALTERMSAYGRLGYAYIDVDAKILTPGGNRIRSVADAESGPAFGAGLSYDMTEKWYLKGDYTYYSFDGANTDGVMLGIGYNF